MLFRSISMYQNRRFVCLDYMVIIQLLMEIIVQDCQVAFTQSDHPVGHVLTCDAKTITGKLLFQAIERNSIDILAIHNRCSKCWRYQTSVKQCLWVVCFYNSSIFLTGIHTDMMLIYFSLCRDETVTFGNRIWKLLPAIFSKLSY